MTTSRRFPFVLAPFPDPRHDSTAIRARLLATWRRFRGRKEGIEPPRRADGSIDRRAWDRSAENVFVPRPVNKRIDDWADDIAMRHGAKTQLSNLGKDDMRRLEPFRGGGHLRFMPSVDEADELAAALHEEFPWMAEATGLIWRALRRSAVGEHGVRVLPMLLVGPPGIGKTAWARRLSELLGVAGVLIDASGENASFSVTRLQKGWSSAAVGRPLDLILRTQGMNPIIVVDEIDKAGDVTSSKGTSHGLANALLPFLETSSAARWDCPVMRVPFDMSWIGWVLTANDMGILSEPLVSRCTAVRLRRLTKDELLAFATREGVRRGLREPGSSALLEALGTSIDGGAQLDLRKVTRLVEHAIDLQSRPRPH